MLSLSSVGFINSVTLKPLLLTISSALVGGGAISGITSIELENRSISRKFNDWGTTLINVFSAPSKNNVVPTSSFLDNWFNSLSSFFSNLSTHVNNAYESTSSISLTVIEWLRGSDLSIDKIKNIYKEVEDWMKQLNVDWTESFSSLLSELWIQKTELKKIFSKIVEHHQLLGDIFQEINKNKSDWIGALNWISEKAGGYRELFRYLLRESNSFSAQLTKLKERWTSISSQLSTIASKINERKNDINEILKDLDTSTLSGEKGLWPQLKSNLSDHVIALSEQVNNFDNWITQLKEQREKVKKLIGESGDAITTWFEKKEELSEMLELDKSKEGSKKDFPLNEVITKLKDMNDSSISRLGEIQNKLIENKGASRLLIKKAGEGWTGFISLVNKWDKYKTVFELYSTNSGSASISIS